MPREPQSSRRRRMAPEARREMILDAAQSLFMSQGWDSVTITDVISSVGISKGGFYHHYATKEDLLEGIVARMTAQVLDSAQSAIGAETGDALASFNAFIGGSVRWKLEHAPELRMFTDVLTKPGNDVLFQRIFSASARAVMPVIQNLIARGAEEGSFDVADVATTAETIVNLATGRRAVLAEAIEIARHDDLDAASRHLNTRMQAEGALCDRLLGLPKGSITLSKPSEYRQMLDAMTDNGGYSTPKT